MDRNGLTNGDLAWYIPHQANPRIIEAVAARLGLPMNRMMVNVDKYGNTSAASIPICLSEWSIAGRLSRGDTLVMCSIGAGYVHGSVLLRWNLDKRA
jgi:3-oxoacyl-[acyl-carrier-protein] synthase-3